MPSPISTGEFRKKMAFFDPHWRGAGVGVLLFSQIIQFFFTEYNAPTRACFGADDRDTALGFPHSGKKTVPGAVPPPFLR